MSHRKDGYPKPRWLNYVPPKWINTDTKRLYAYLCIFGPNSCDHWNCRLAKKFYVSTRTIARRLRKLRELGLVWVANPQSPYRILHPLYYAKIEDWLLTAQRKTISDNLGRMGARRQIPLGQKCPSESVNSSLRSELPSKVRARNPGPGYPPGGLRPHRPPVGSSRKDFSAKDRLYTLWVKHFIAMGYDDTRAHRLAERVVSKNLKPPS